MTLWTIGWLLCTCALLTWPGITLAQGHSDQPLALEAIVAGLPFDGQDLRIGAGLAFLPTKPLYVRADVVEHCSGLTLNHRFVLLSVVELSAGAGVLYEFTTHRVRPAVTLARILF